MIFAPIMAIHELGLVMRARDINRISSYVIKKIYKIPPLADSLRQRPVEAKW
ncbi:MAG TPA: hypothetical protein VFP47_05605 [Pyrinomonadaceae bacterium]|nr:hypothetical protein [Pyrinomonadaceae bacterium]